MTKASPRNRSRKLSRYNPRKDRHTSSLLTDHIVITPKYRGRVLKGEVAVDCERIIRDTCFNMDVEVLEMAVAEDHVHLFVQHPPRLAPSKMVEKIKSNSSRKLREKHPHLVNWCPKALWAPGCFHGSVGQGFDVVENYIAGQK
jgi:putative transposase